jgi:hypothetical protein
VPVARRPNLVRRLADHPIMLAAGMIAIALALGSAVFDALKEPDIYATENADPSRPFAIPFIVKNNSSIFSLRGTTLWCGIDEIRNIYGGGMSQLAIDVRNSPLDVDPSGQDNFWCKTGDSPTDNFRF